MSVQVCHFCCRDMASHVRDAESNIIRTTYQRILAHSGHGKPCPYDLRHEDNFLAPNAPTKNRSKAIYKNVLINDAVSVEFFESADLTPLCANLSSI